MTSSGSSTDIFGYSENPLTVTVLVNPMLSKSVTVSKYLLTFTRFPCPEDVCSYRVKVSRTGPEKIVQVKVEFSILNKASPSLGKEIIAKNLRYPWEYLKFVGTVKYRKLESY